MDCTCIFIYLYLLKVSDIPYIYLYQYIQINKIIYIYIYLLKNNNMYFVPSTFLRFGNMNKYNNIEHCTLLIYINKIILILSLYIYIYIYKFIYAIMILSRDTPCSRPVTWNGLITRDVARRCDSMMGMKVSKDGHWRWKRPNLYLISRKS